VLRRWYKIRLASGASLANVDRPIVSSGIRRQRHHLRLFALVTHRACRPWRRTSSARRQMRALISEGLSPDDLTLRPRRPKDRIDLLVISRSTALSMTSLREAGSSAGGVPTDPDAADMVAGTRSPPSPIHHGSAVHDLTKVSSRPPRGLGGPRSALRRSPQELPARPATRSPAVWLRAAQPTSGYLDPPRVAWQTHGLALRRRAEENSFICWMAALPYNLGVSEPYRLLTIDDVPGVAQQDIRRGARQRSAFA